MSKNLRCDKCARVNTNPPSYKGVFYCHYCGYRNVGGKNGAK